MIRGEEAPYLRTRGTGGLAVIEAVKRAARSGAPVEANQEPTQWGPAHDQGHDTRLIGHLDYPTESFKAPMIYNPYFQREGIDAVVVPMGCRSADYPDFLKLFFRLTNAHGAGDDHPHKVTTIGLVDVLSPTAAMRRACNAVCASKRMAGSPATCSTVKTTYAACCARAASWWRPRARRRRRRRRRLRPSPPRWRKRRRRELGLFDRDASAAEELGRA